MLRKFALGASMVAALMFGGGLAFSQPAAADNWQVVIGSDGDFGLSYNTGHRYGGKKHHGNKHNGGGYKSGGKHKGGGHYSGGNKRHGKGHGYTSGYGNGHNKGHNKGYNGKSHKRKGHNSGGHYGKGHHGNSYYTGYNQYGYGRNCHQVSKKSRWHGRKARVGATKCYDSYGNGYIVEGSRYLIHYR